MKPLELSVIVPCFNEALNLRELCTRVLHAFDVGGIRGELVLVDDGSRDATAPLIRELSCAFPARVRGCFHPINRGIAEAWRTGVHAAKGGLVATIDADLQYQPEDLLRLHAELLDSRCDIVQGFRSPVGRRKDQRYYLSRAWNVMLNATFAMSLRDNKSGFVMCRREVLADLLTYRARYHYFQSFIMVSAHAKGYTYREVETIFEQRRQGASFLERNAIRASLRSLRDLSLAAREFRTAPASPGERGRGEASVAPPVAPTHPLPERGLRWKAYIATFNQTHWMISRDVERYCDELQHTQWLSASELRDLQDEKLRRLVSHAYRHVPYYRRRMQERRLTPSDIRSQADLRKLPFLSKDDVRQHLYLGMMSDNHNKSEVLRIATSGSTGEPFVCYVDRAQLEFRWAATLRGQEWTGYRFGDPTVRLWHQTLGMTREQVFRERLDARLLNRKFIPVFEFTEQNLATMVRLISEHQPVLLDGYAEAIDFLAGHIRDGGGLHSKPRAIISSAQTLPRASRTLIESAFGCKVFDKYGSREFSGLAYECEAHSGHHVVAEGYIVEILRNGEPALPGEMGEVFVTDLNNFCLPFVRYRIGDLAEAVDEQRLCACGRTAPRIGEILGRTQSMIQGTDGRCLPGTFFAHYLKEFDHAIRRFQVVQEQQGKMVFRVVKGGRFSSEVLEEVIATFRKHLGHDMGIETQFVDNLELVRTGKRISAISQLPVDFQEHAPAVIQVPEA